MECARETAQLKKERKKACLVEKALTKSPKKKCFEDNGAV